MKFSDIFSGLVLMALSLLILLTVKDYPDIPGQNIGPGAFPGLLAALLALCSVLLIFKGIKTQRHTPWLVWGEWVTSRFHFRNFLITIGCLVFYITVSDFLGFLICSSAVLATMFTALGVRWKWTVMLSIIVTLVVHTIFYKALRVPLPWGILSPIQW
jgi:putative tricarboxylic transport membrane protein